MMILKLLLCSALSAAGFRRLVRSGRSSKNATMPDIARRLMRAIERKDAVITSVDGNKGKPTFAWEDEGDMRAHHADNWRVKHIPMGALVDFLDMVKEKYEEEAASGAYAKNVKSAKGGHSVIIGDIHGQLFFMLPMLEDIKNKHPDYKLLPGSDLLVCDKRLQYVFLGDFVDRGAHGIEVATLALAYKVLCPYVTLLRGNHELKEINEMYGFTDEVIRFEHATKFATKSLEPTIPEIMNELQEGRQALQMQSIEIGRNQFLARKFKSARQKVRKAERELQELAKSVVQIDNLKEMREKAKKEKAKREQAKKKAADAMKWVYAGIGKSCTGACEDLGRLCDAKELQTVTSEAKIEEVLKKAVGKDAECGFYHDYDGEGNWDGPWYEEWMDAANARKPRMCGYHQLGQSATCEVKGGIVSPSAYRRLCPCRAPEDPRRSVLPIDLNATERPSRGMEDLLSTVRPEDLHSTVRPENLRSTVRPEDLRSTVQLTPQQQLFDSDELEVGSWIWDVGDDAEWEAELASERKIQVLLFRKVLLDVLSAPPHRQDSSLYKRFLGIFERLPLVAVVEDMALAMHAGLQSDLVHMCWEEEFDKCLTKAMQMNSGDRLSPPIEGVLWSDPSNDPHSPGFSKNTARGAGQFFSADATYDFLKQKDLKWLVRGHQAKMEGFEEIFYEKSGAHRLFDIRESEPADAYPDKSISIFTVFSAGDYCGFLEAPRMQNSAAYLVVGPAGAPVVHKLRPDNARMMLSNMGKSEDQALQALEDAMKETSVDQIIQHYETVLRVKSLKDVQEAATNMELDMGNGTEQSHAFEKRVRETLQTAIARGDENGGRTREEILAMEALRLIEETGEAPVKEDQLVTYTTMDYSIVRVFDELGGTLEDKQELLLTIARRAGMQLHLPQFSNPVSLPTSHETLQKPPPKVIYVLAFRSIDRDGDGKIQIDELRDALESVQEKPGRKVDIHVLVNAAFSAVTDGGMTLGEFIGVMQGDIVSGNEKEQVCGSSAYQEATFIGYWSNAFSMSTPYGLVIDAVGTTNIECAAACDAAPACVAFNLYASRACYIYDSLGAEVVADSQETCIKAMARGKSIAL